MLQATSEETQLSRDELSGRDGVNNAMKNSHVVPKDIKMSAGLVSAGSKTSDRDNRISSQSTNDQLLTTSSTIRNSSPITNVRLGKTLDSVSEKSNTLPNKTSGDNKASDTRANVRVGSVWSTASIFDTIAKSEEKSKLNVQNQNDKPAVKPRTNTAWSKLRHSLGHNFSAKSPLSQTETTPSKDFGLDLAVRTQCSKSDDDNSLKSEHKDVAKTIDTSSNRIHAPRTIDKKSKMESNLSIRGSISPTVVINPEIPRYRKTSLKSIAQITDSLEQDFRKSQELSSPSPSSGNEFQENVSTANVICDSNTVKSSSGFTQFKEHIPTEVGHVHKVIAVNDSKNSSSFNPDDGRCKKIGTTNQNFPDIKVQSSSTTEDVRQAHEKEVKHTARMVDIAAKFGNEHGTPKLLTPKSINNSDGNESLIKRQNSQGTKTASVSHALIFDVVDVQNTKMDYCNATDRINNALNKLKTELMSMRQMDLLLLKQLINISQTIQKIQKSRVLRVSKSLSFSSSYLHPKPLQSQTHFHSSTLERQNSAPFTMERKRLMYRDMRSSTESKLLSMTDVP
ncbi:unnamed protein product [Lymnaea stagnalis]|uniref:Uncharacterized protein n=1 Tax=Lymnaea stagnalis TaxID=6523 RepID=A0AAV2IN73_LYMST